MGGGLCCRMCLDAVSFFTVSQNQQATAAAPLPAPFSGQSPFHFSPLNSQSEPLWSEGKGKYEKSECPPWKGAFSLWLFPSFALPRALHGTPPPVARRLGRHIPRFIKETQIISQRFEKVACEEDKTGAPLFQAPAAWRKYRWAGKFKRLRIHNTLCHCVRKAADGVANVIIVQLRARGHTARGWLCRN